MTWLTATADELDALARRLGADRFPGVTRSIFDELPADRHPLLAERFVATLTARELVLSRDGRLVLAPGAAALLDPVVTGPVRYVVEHEGRLVLAPGAAALLDPVVTGTVRYVVDREDATGTESSVVAVGRRGHVVRHRVDGDLHRFDLLDTGGDVDAALAALGVPVAPAGAVARAVPGRTLADQLPAPEHWHSVAVVRRVEELAGDASAVSWRVTVDLGDGDVRTVEPAADDDTLDPEAEPLFTLLGRRPG